MIQRLPESEGSALGVKVTGKVSLEMEKEWIRTMDKVVEEHGKISVLVYLDDHASWGLKAGIEDLKWLFTHLKSIKKVGFVADSNFWKWYVALDSPFGKMIGIDEKYFKPADMTDAWKWLKK